MAPKENKEDMKKQKMVIIHQRWSHVASAHLFFSKVLKSNSPESSFPSVLLQNNQSAAVKAHQQPIAVFWQIIFQIKKMFVAIFVIEVHNCVCTQYSDWTSDFCSFRLN